MTMGPGGRRRWFGRARLRTAGQCGPEPSGPPIEQVAADLRRLLWRHDRLSRSGDASRATWLRALEAAISSRAIKAARALEVPYQEPQPCSGLETEDLRRLLRALAAEGLVLPREVGLLTPGGRH